MTAEEFFNKNNCYKLTPDGSINTRCPFCGDSHKANHQFNYGQSYIFKDGYFKCFKCGKYATAKDAIIKISVNLGINPPEELINEFKVTSIKYIMKSPDKFTYYKNDEQTINDYRFKLKYLQQRTNHEITVDYLNNNKIVLDLDPFHEQLNKRFKSFEPNKYIGFMTSNNKKINLRRIDDKNIMRYVILSAASEFDFWTTEDFMNQLFKTKTVVIGEGIFDVMNKNTQALFKGAYVASLSKGNITSTIIKIFTESLTKFNVIILKDRDVHNSYIRYIYRRIKPMIKSFKVYENLAGKDFGEKNVISELIFTKGV